MKSTHKAPDYRGYSWLSFDLTASWFKTTLATLAITGACFLFLVIYAHYSSDLSPDSLAGYTYAIVGTLLMLMAAFSYTIHRKRRRQVGSLNNALNWHICFGASAIIVLFFHSFGNFNPRTGTYALYGMIALVISGIVGRIIDRVVPRLIAQEAQSALTSQGEDRVEQIAQRAQQTVFHNTQKLRALSHTNTSRPERQHPGNPFDASVPAHPLKTGAADFGSSRPVAKAGDTLPGSWDIAYLTVEETPQELERNEAHHRFVPDQKSPLLDPGALIPGYDQQIAEIQRIQRATQRELLYRSLIRAWRSIHVLLVFLTIGLTFWHLEYAAALLLPLLFKSH